MICDKGEKRNIYEEKGISYAWNSPFSRFLIDWMEHKVDWISDSVKEGKRLWIKVKNSVPIYWIEWNWWYRKWSYDIRRNVIYIFDNADDETLKHEIIHSIEFNKIISWELNKFYDIVKQKVTEESFDAGVVSFNFKKNIHEFIADWYSKKIFENALKKEWIYDEFLVKTAYIFE